MSDSDKKNNATLDGCFARMDELLFKAKAAVEAGNASEVSLYCRAAEKVGLAGVHFVETVKALEETVKGSASKVTSSFR